MARQNFKHFGAISRAAFFRGRAAKGAGRGGGVGSVTPAAAAFSLKTDTFLAKSGCKPVPGARCWCGAWRRRGQGSFGSVPVPCSPPSVCLADSHKSLVEARSSRCLPCSFIFIFFTALSEQLGHLRRQPEVPPAPPQPLLSPTGAKLVGLGRPKALVSGLESFQLGTYGPGAGGDGAAEWEGGREGFQAAENVPKVDAFGPANFPPAGGSSAGRTHAFLAPRSSGGMGHGQIWLLKTVSKRRRTG